MTITEIVLALLLVASALGNAWLLWHATGLQLTLDRIGGIWEADRAILDAYPMAEELPDEGAGEARVFRLPSAGTTFKQPPPGKFEPLALALALVLVTVASVTSAPAQADPMNPARFNQMVQGQQLTRIARQTSQQACACESDLGLVIALMQQNIELQAELAALKGATEPSVTPAPADPGSDAQPNPTALKQEQRYCHESADDKAAAPKPVRKSHWRRWRKLHDHVPCPVVTP